MLKLGCNKSLSINKKGCKSRVKSMLFSSENAFFLVVLRPSYTRTTAVERVVWRPWYTSNDGHHTLSLWHKRTSITPLCFHYSAIIEYKKGKQRLMKTFCLPRYIFFILLLVVFGDFTSSSSYFLFQFERVLLFLFYTIAFSV